MRLKVEKDQEATRERSRKSRWSGVHAHLSVTTCGIKVQMFTFSSPAPPPLSQGGFQFVAIDTIMIFVVTFGAFESQTDLMPTGRGKRLDEYKFSRIIHKPFAQIRQ